MRKTLILAAATLALAAMAAPAGASAETSNWKMEGQELTENGTVTITAHTRFTGGIACHLHIHVIFLAGSGTGELTTYEATECEPTETLATVCSSVTEVTPEGLPWMLDDEGSSVKVSGIHMTEHFSGGLFCPSAIAIEDDAESGVFVTPNSTEHMETGVLSGSVETSLGTQTVEGGGEATEGSGTYGL